VKLVGRRKHWLPFQFESCILSRNMGWGGGCSVSIYVRRHAVYVVMKYFRQSDGVTEDVWR
jgi:hypothetical protein